MVSKIKRMLGIGLLVVLIPVGGFACGVGLLRAVQSMGELPPLREGDFRAITESVGSPVVLLSTSTCPWCEKTRQWLDLRGISYRDCVIDRDAFANGLMEIAGGKSVPQLLNAGSAASGYDPELFAQIVREASPPRSSVQRCDAPGAGAPVSVVDPEMSSSIGSTAAH